MAVQQPSVSMPGWGESSGHVYVILFSSGTVKVGRTRTPRVRLKAHAASARPHGVSVVSQWVSQPHASASANERKMIEHCNDTGSPLNGGEYFAGADVDRVLAFCATLPAGPGELVRMAPWDPIAMKDGRPPIGPAFSVRFPQDLLDSVDAARDKTSRAEWLRVAAEMRLKSESASD